MSVLAISGGISPNRRAEQEAPICSILVGHLRGIRTTWTSSCCWRFSYKRWSFIICFKLWPPIITRMHIQVIESLIKKCRHRGACTVVCWKLWYQFNIFHPIQNVVLILYWPVQNETKNNSKVVKWGKLKRCLVSITRLELEKDKRHGALL